MKLTTSEETKATLREMFDTLANELNNNPVWTFNGSLVQSAVVQENSKGPLLEVELHDAWVRIYGDAFVKAKGGS